MNWILHQILNWRERAREICLLNLSFDFTLCYLIQEHILCLFMLYVKKIISILSILYTKA